MTIGVGAGGAGSTPLPSSDFTPTGTDVAADNTYHHLVLVDDGAGSSTAYYRSPSDAGHLVYSLGYTGTTGGAGLFGIGVLLTPGPDLFASGRVDDVALFNRVLTQAEVESIFAAGSVGDLFAQPVPEPSTLALAALGLVGLVGFRRRRNRC